MQPQNIVLMSEFPNCEIKLCDLEVSRVIQDTEDLREIIGTPDYVGECCMTCIARLAVIEDAMNMLNCAPKPPHGIRAPPMLWVGG